MISKQLSISPLPLQGAFLLSPMRFEDERGVFSKLYTRDCLSQMGALPQFVEEYVSVSKKGVLRGLHYQTGAHSQAKLVRCIKGEILDAIVDLRKSSPTFGKAAAALLSEENMLSLYAPRGFAHGFLCLTEGASVLYKADNDYAPAHERGITYDDPALGINWQIKNPILSQKDKSWPLLKDAQLFE